MKQLGFLLLLIVFCSQGFAQPFYPTYSVPVTKNNVAMKNPWVGGMNAPQFSPVDWNGDGKQDLFVFDRGGNKAYTFINKGNGVFEYAPQYEKPLPLLENWALIRDYNKDNVPDIFCWANGGITVYKGIKQNGQLSFELRTYTRDTLGNKVTDLLTFTNLSATGTPEVNIYVMTDDIPGIIDVNGDGDLDVLSFGNSGASVEYYENLTVERSLSADTLVFDSDNFNNCWGGFVEAAFSNTVFLGACKDGGIVYNPGDAPRHAGSSLCPFDKDGDGDIDLLLGDIAYPTMIYLKNGGDNISASMTEYDSIYPAYNTSISIPIFPAAYIADVDDDGKNDLLAAPNARTLHRNIKNVQWYKNVGSNSNYDLRLQTDSFLVGDILDFGVDSKVAVFDYNGDGLQDIIVGNSQVYLEQFQNKASQVALLLNTGTATAPSFRLETTDFAGIKNYTLNDIQPAFGDLDGDGKADMILGDENGYLHFFKNTGGTTANFASLTTTQYFGIDAQRNAAPYIFDIDADGDNDLIIGTEDGRIRWYINYGTAQAPQFRQDSVVLNWGGINVTGQYEINGYAQPILYATKDSVFMLVGTNRGEVFKYFVEPSRLRGGGFPLLATNYLGKGVGTKATVGLADFTGDGKPDFVTGNSLGGVSLFTSTPIDPSTGIEETYIGIDWTIYPNPAGKSFIVSLKNDMPATVEVYSLMGKLMASKEFLNATEIDSREFTSGMYLIKLTSSDKNEVRKVLVTH